MGVYIPSEDELESQGGDFALVPEDLYVVEVIRRKVKDLETPDTVMQPNPYNKTEEHPGGVPRPVLQVVMRAISFSNGDPLVTDDGDDIPAGQDVLFFAFLDTTKVGLKPQPSNFRKFITAAMGKKVEETVAIEEWDELVGARLIAQVKHNKGKHKVGDFLPLRTRRRAAKAEEAPAAAPASNDEALADKAKEVFGDEAPSF